MIGPWLSAGAMEASRIGILVFSRRGRLVRPSGRCPSDTLGRLNDGEICSERGPDWNYGQVWTVENE